MSETDDTMLFAKDLEHLPADTRAHINRIVYEHGRLVAENSLMAEEIRLLRAKRFAPSSEKGIYITGQQLLFNEAEHLARKGLPEPLTGEVSAPRRKKRAGKRAQDLSGLDRRRIDYEVDPDERICPQCSGRLHEIDVDIRLELEYIPASYTVIEHATHVYGCRHCQTHAEATPIINALSPKALFRGSLASASLLAQVITDKYHYHLPLYRQESAFATDGLGLSRQTLANWVIQASEQWLGPIYERMKARLVQGSLVMADETTVQVLREDMRRAQNKSYMWLYRTGSDAGHPLILYEYKPSRSHECPKKFLKGFSGYLQVDGYQAYRLLGPDIDVACCWAHARRAFEEAYEVIDEARRAGSVPGRGLGLINTLFAYDKQFADMSAPERKSARDDISLPVAAELFEWAEGVTSVLPKSKAGKAIAYILNIKPYLLKVFDDGRLELSNNRSERSIKPFVIGRKNWLFSNTPRGAEASATVFSIVETAKENGLRVYDYLNYLFERLPNTTTSQIDAVMPWSDSLPDHVKVPTAY